MGSFIGHMIPGSFFVVLGAWWMIMLCRRVLQNRRSRGKIFYGAPTITGPVGRFRVDPEALFGVLSCVVGMLVELRGLYLTTSVVKPHNAQHATIYLFFGTESLLILFRECLQRHMPDVDGVLSAGLAMSYAVEGMLFHFHLFGRDPLDVNVHTLLVYTCYLCAICCLCETWKPQAVMPKIGRIFFTFVQGTWYWQVAFILYNPVPGHEDAWDHEDPHQLMLVACIYAWNMGGVFVGAILLGALLSFCHQRRHGTILDGIPLGPDNGYAKLIAEPPDSELGD